MSKPISQERAKEIADRYFRDGETVVPEDRDETFDNPSRSGGVTHKRLTPKEAAFCEFYLVSLNAAEAARQAGYSERTAKEIGYENLTKPHIRTRIRQLKRERSVRTKWDADRVLMRLGDELDADLADIFDEHGGLLPVEDWPPAFRTGLVAGIEVEQLFEGRGEDREHVGRVVKVKLADRGKRIEMIGKHVGVMAFKERAEVDTPAGGTLAQLLGQLQGTSIRPTQAPPVSAPVNPDAVDDDEDGDD